MLADSWSFSIESTKSEVYNFVYKPDMNHPVSLRAYSPSVSESQAGLRRRSGKTFTQELQCYRGYVYKRLQNCWKANVTHPAMEKKKREKVVIFVACVTNRILIVVVT